MATQTRPTRIVLVGDGGDVVRNMLKALRNVHYTLCFVRDIHQVLLLSPRHAFDVFFLDASQDSTRAEFLLRRGREALPFLPIVIIVRETDALERERLYRAGAWKVWALRTFSLDVIRETLLSLSCQPGGPGSRRDDLIEQVLASLQANSPVSDLYEHNPNRESLRTILPLKFLELTRSYGNLLDLALVPPEAKRRMSGHSVSHKLQFLASDLALLHAGAHDVLEVHEEALAARGRRDTSDPESRRLLIELLTDLAARYRATAESTT